MRRFDRLFGSSELRAARAVPKRVDAEVSATDGPLGQLTEAIVRTADGVWRTSARWLDFTLEGTPSEQQILVYYEFLYFFSHLAFRIAFTAGFTKAQIARLQRYVARIVSSTAVSMFFGEWPEELRQKMRSEFYERLKEADAQYAECPGLVSSENPVDDTTLMGLLAANIAEICEKPRDRLIIMTVFAKGTKAYGRMHLKKLIADVHPVIDSASDDLPSDYFPTAPWTS